jgi:hypothetical protein
MQSGKHAAAVRRKKKPKNAFFYQTDSKAFSESKERKEIFA